MLLTALSLLFTLNVQAQVNPTMTTENFKKDCVKHYTLQKSDLSEQSYEYKTSQLLNVSKSADGSTVVSVIQTLGDGLTDTRVTETTEIRETTLEGNIKHTYLSTGVWPITIKADQAKDVSQTSKVVVEKVTNTTQINGVTNSTTTEEISDEQTFNLEMQLKGGLYSTQTTDFGNGKTFTQSTLKTLGVFGSAGTDYRESAASIECVIQKLFN